MSLPRAARVLIMLRGRAHLLPDDFRVRQEQVWARLKTGQVLQLAGVVRDLSWHRKRAHLTKRDSEFLRQGLEQLAAEMALVSGDNVRDTNKLIQATVTAAIAGAAN
jgi:RNA polymerase-interacting CarD/CdnL/TRCF family regulator